MDTNHPEQLVIYKCRNILNSKCYIGKTTNFEKRKKDHIRNAINNYQDYPFYRAIRKYGIDNFEWSIIYVATDYDDLNEKEKFYIIENDSYSNKNGYNATFGGDGIDGFKHSEEFKIKLSKRLIGNKYTSGVKLSDEHKKKLSLALKGISRPQCGKPCSDEMKKHLSLKTKGIKHSEEHRAKLDIANKSRIKNDKYEFINIDGRTFSGRLYDFAIEYNLDRSSCTKLIKNKVKSTLGWSLNNYNQN